MSAVVLPNMQLPHLQSADDDELGHVPAREELAPLVTRSVASKLRPVDQILILNLHICMPKQQQPGRRPQWC